MRRTLSGFSVLLALPALLAAQQPAATMPKVGDMAPDFTLPAATIAGISAQPVKLSSLRGKTVVIAFFPRQRSSGCTIQMKAYRDKYADLFHGGKNVVLLAVSTDSAKDTASWAQDEKFPFTFVSDAGGTAGRLYATLSTRGTTENRVVFVVAPNGKIATVMNPFREVDATAYDDLGKAINEAPKTK